MTTRVKKKIRGPRKDAAKGAVDLFALGRRIRELRGFDMQQADFAKMLGVSQSQLSKYERGESEPPLEVLMRLCEKYGKSLDFLVRGKE
jgi:transcriptional regulator with XRE-family HTH domain